MNKSVHFIILLILKTLNAEETIVSVITNDETSNEKLQCTVNKFISPSLGFSFEWQKDNEILNATRLNNLNAFILNNGQVLAFHNLTSKVDGFYKCIIRLTDGRQFESKIYKVNATDKKEYENESTTPPIVEIQPEKDNINSFEPHSETMENNSMYWVILISVFGILIAVTSCVAYLMRIKKKKKELTQNSTTSFDGVNGDNRNINNVFQIENDYASICSILTINHSTEGYYSIKDF